MLIFFNSATLKKTQKMKNENKKHENMTEIGCTDSTSRLLYLGVWGPNKMTYLECMTSVLQSILVWIVCKIVVRSLGLDYSYTKGRM